MARGPSEVPQMDPTIMADVELLWDVAAKRNLSRTDDTIRVGSSKVKFEFASADSFSPTKCWSESPSDSPAPNSHSLIEEFMVLANRLVAERLVEGIDMNGKSPPPPILRQHPNTEAQVVETILPILQRGCPDHDWTSGRWHGRRLAALLEEARKILPDPCFKALSFEAMVAFQMAQYVVVTDPEEDDTAHWALGLGRYMHFTSPIRRYADVLVHRLLTDLVCEGASVYKHSVDELIGATSRCNQIRKGSLEADRECAYYFFSDYVRANYSENGMNLNDLVVTKIFPGKEIAKGKFTKDAIEVFVPLVGYSKSVSLEQIGVEKTEKITQDSVTFLREGRLVEWKTLSVVSMKVVCPSGDDSVLKHWTLRLPVANSAEKSSECAEEGVSKSIRKSSECGENRKSSEEGKLKGIQKTTKCGKKGAPQNVRESSECGEEEVSKSIPKPAGGGKKSKGIRKSSECASTVPPPPPPPPSSPPVNGSIRPVLPLLPHGPAFAVLRTRLERSVGESNPGASIAARKGDYGLTATAAFGGRGLFHSLLFSSEGAPEVDIGTSVLECSSDSGVV
ncbi:DIS3 mitotic control [Perkinsus olseni]|uniref:DIS3 mitotic control n=1 Tax=Perkinsus olseni TaxID=32597 RepID=A0A7J6TQQ3_PEROL|nr:DIS3 mitotic control [Perkinsus olseni]